MSNAVVGQIWIFRASMTLKFEVRNSCRGGKVFARERDHLRRGVNAGDRTARHGAGDFRRHLAVAAADIENVFVAAQIELAMSSRAQVCCTAEFAA